MEKNCAIVTGAGSGIGRAIAVELSRVGYGVALVGRRRETLEETAQLVGDGVVVVADVSEARAGDMVVGEAVKKFGRVDVVVNNAGFAPVVRVKDLTEEVWRRIVDTNLSAAVYLVKAAWALFEKQKGGVVVNISSESARDPFLGLGAYGAAKAGLNLLTKAIAMEGKEIGVRAHALALAAVETEMLRGIVSKEQLPTEQILQPRDVAKVVVECVRGAMVHTSGEVIYVHK